MHWESFYVDPQNVEEESLHFDEEETRHLHVLRKKAGDTVWAVNGKGTAFQVRIDSIHKQVTQCTILERRRRLNEPTTQITLAQGLIKGDRFDWLVEKSTELGAHRIIPMVTEKSIVKPSAQKRNRWQRIALSAMKQSGRTWLPDITESKTFKQVLSLSAGFSQNYMIEKTKESMPLSLLKKSETSHITQKILILIGSEGGFAPSEIDEAKSFNFKLIHLGDRRLRAETAGIIALSLMLYESDDMN